MNAQSDSVRTKRRTAWAIYLWPGLPQLTQWGSWTGLFWALATSFLADVVVVTVYIWPETFPVQVTRLLCAAFCGVYVVGCFLSHRHEMLRTDYGRLEMETDLFPQAQKLYLKGRYFESEKILQNQLERQPQDVPARILFIDLLKNTNRYQEALENLEYLLDLPDAVQWRWEIFALEDQLKQLASEQPNQDDNQILELPAAPADEQRRAA